MRHNIVYPPGLSKIERKRFYEKAYRAKWTRADWLKQAKYQKDSVAKNRRRKYLANRAWQQRHPEQWEANRLLNYAVQSGKITRPNICSICNSECTPQGHHSDYSKPLDVVWMCGPCHIKSHNKTPLLSVEQT